MAGLYHISILLFIDDEIGNMSVIVFLMQVCDIKPLVRSVGGVGRDDVEIMVVVMG